MIELEHAVTCGTGGELLHDKMDLQVVGLEQVHQLALQIILGGTNSLVVLADTERLVRHDHPHVQLHDATVGGGGGNRRRLHGVLRSGRGRGNARCAIALEHDAVATGRGNGAVSMMVDADAAAALHARVLPRGPAAHHDRNQREEGHDVHRGHREGSGSGASAGGHGPGQRHSATSGARSESGGPRPIGAESCRTLTSRGAARDAELRRPSRRLVLRIAPSSALRC